MMRRGEALFKFSAYGFLKNLRFFEPFLYLFFLENGLSYFQIGLLISIREVGINLLEVPTGAIADLTGRRRAMVLSFTSYIFSFLTFYFFSNFLLFVPAMVLFSLGETFRSGTHKSMIMEYLDINDMAGEQVSYYGKTRSASRLGSALSALVAALIVYFRGNYNVIFLATLVPYSFDLLLMLTYPAELDGEIENPQLSLASMKAQFFESFRSIFSTGELGRMIANASIYDSLFRIGKDYLQPIIKTNALALPLLASLGKDEGSTAIAIGVVYFFIYLNSFISSRKSSTVMESLGSLSRAANWILWIAAILFVVAGGGLLGGSILIPVVAFFFFYTLYNLRKPMVVGFLGTRVESGQRATVLSVHSQARALVGIVVAPIFGLLADKFGLASVLFAGAAALAITGVLLEIREEG